MAMFRWDSVRLGETAYRIPMISPYALYLSLLTVPQKTECVYKACAMRRPRILLADDHQMLVDALKQVLEPRYEVVATVRDGRALLEAAARLQPDIIVLDIGMPRLNGLDAGSHLKRSLPKAKLVFMTMNEDPDMVGEAFRAGASAFLLKHGAAFELTEAIDKVLKGGSYVTPQAAEGQANIALRDPRAREHRQELTSRQREVIQLLAEGRSMKEAASVLKITKRTIAAHKYTVMENLQLKTNAELVQYAIKHHIVSI
jgi:DNA-binding NarL/FixJ family response regulator